MIMSPVCHQEPSTTKLNISPNTLSHCKPEDVGANIKLSSPGSVWIMRGIVQIIPDSSGTKSEVADQEQYLGEIYK